MNRLLVQFIIDNPFGCELKEIAVFETFNKAVDVAISLINNKKIHTILVNDGSKWVRIK
jgi:hypothetical protein